MQDTVLSSRDNKKDKRKPLSLPSKSLQSNREDNIHTMRTQKVGNWDQEDGGTLKNNGKLWMGGGSAGKDDWFSFGHIEFKTATEHPVQDLT